MEVQEVKEQLKAIFRMVINNDKWITIHPNGEDGKGRPLLLKDGETPKEAIERTYGKKESKGEGNKTKKEEKKPQKYGFDGTNYKELENIFKDKIKESQNYYDYGKVSVLTSDGWETVFKGDSIDIDEDGNIKVTKMGMGKLKKPDTKGEKSDTKDGKDLYSDENFKYNAKRLNEQFGEKPYSEWKKDVQTMLKKYGKTEEDFDNAIGARKDAFKQSDTKDKQSESKGDLDIKKTTVKMKSGKEREIEYVDKVPEGYKKLEGAMTAPLGYTWYHNGKSLFDKDRRTILVKDNKTNNSKEQDMALLEEIKKLITKVENNKENEMEIENGKVDKRDIIRQIMAIAGKEEASEDVKTIAKLAEKLAYDKSEAGTADNKKVKNEEEEKEEVENKKCKNEDEEDKEKVEEIEEEVKEDVENKCKNSKEESSFEKINAIYNSIKQVQNESKYTSRQDKLDAAKEYFS